jgi:hypothetical protein
LTVPSGAGHEAADHRGVGGIVIGQFVSDDLVVVGIDREMQLAPRTARFAMPGPGPLAGAGAGQCLLSGDFG